jgi:hypothetical protein
MTNLIDKVLEQREDPYDVLGLVFSNIQQASQKQKKPNLEKLFSLLSASFEIQAKNREKDSILQKDQRERADPGLSGLWIVLRDFKEPRSFRRTGCFP